MLLLLPDMLWRLRPDLFIELGTSGGGSAAFWAHVMAQYNPNAKVLTMDPSIQGAGSQKSAPLQPWNYGAVKRFCPHCIAANESKVTQSPCSARPFIDLATSCVFTWFKKTK